MPLPSIPNYDNKLYRVDTTLFLSSYDVPSQHFQFYVSHDTGNTWQLRLDTTYFFFLSVMFDVNEGILIGDFHQILRTHDGGYSWQLEFFGPPSIRCAKVMGDSTILLGGFQWLNFSDNRYQTWSGVVGGFNYAEFNNFQFLSKDTFLACGFDHFGGMGFLYYTFHGIDSIKTKYFNNSEFQPENVCATSINEIFLVGRNYVLQKGVVYKTMDLGNTWQIYNTGIDCNLMDMYFINDSIALISGTNGIILKWNKNSFATEILDFETTKIHMNAIPNPTSNQQTISIYSSKKEALTIDLYDVFGKKIRSIFNGCTELGITKIETTLLDLPKGIYMYTIKLGNILSQLKIEKQ